MEHILGHKVAVRIFAAFPFTQSLMELQLPHFRINELLFLYDIG